MVNRKCVGCGEIKDRENLIKVTAQNPHGNIVVNGNSKIFGRSAYLCYNKNCIENAFKKERLKYKIEHMASIEEEKKKEQVVDIDDLPIVALKIYRLFDKKDRIDFKYIKDHVDDSKSKIKRNLILQLIIII